MADGRPRNGGSKMYPILDYYQQEGFHELVSIADQYHGAFMCDGVGLGKTFIGLMLIEYSHQEAPETRRAVRSQGCPQAGLGGQASQVSARALRRIQQSSDL